MELLTDDAAVDAGEPGDVVVVPETFAIDERHDAGIPADDEPDAAADAVADPQDSPLVERRRFGSIPEYVPTPAEIEADCRMIRAGWTKGERCRRLTGRWDEVEQ